MEKTIDKFLIGSEYQELELFLEITKDRIIGYDSYMYSSKSLHNNLKQSKYEIELLYYWDILQAVVIKTDKSLFKTSEILNTNYKTSYLTIDDKVFYIYSKSNKLNYKILLSLLC